MAVSECIQSTQSQNATTSCVWIAVPVAPAR